MNILEILMLGMLPFNVVDGEGGSSDGDEDRGDSAEDAVDAGKDKGDGDEEAAKGDDKGGESDKGEGKDDGGAADSGSDKGDKDKDGDKDSDKDTSGYMVPKSRLDFKNRRIQALEDELDAARKQGVSDKKPDEEQTFATQLASLNADVVKFTADGDNEKVVSLQADIQNLMVEHIETLATYTTATATKEATEQIKLDSMIDAIEVKHTILDETHKDFDQEMSDEVLDMYDTFNKSGKYTNADALAKAVELIIGAGSVEQQESDGSARKTDIDKSLDSMNKDPGSNDGKDSDAAGLGSDIEGSKLTEKEFAALPEDTKSRLRGDFVT